MLDKIIEKYDIKNESIYKNDWDYLVEKYYNKLWSLICDQKSVMLEPIWLNISEKQLFDKIIYKLINQGFSYETSRKVLEKMISNGNI